MKMKFGNKIKTGILVGAALASPLSVQKAYSEIVQQQPTEQYEMMEQAGKEAGEDGEFSLEEIVINLPEDSALKITPFAFNQEELRDYYSGLGLDLEAKNEGAIENLSKVTISHYNSIVNDINQLNKQTSMMLEKIESDDQAKTAYSVIKENLSNLESLAENVRRKSFELDDLSELIVATYHASKSISKEDAGKVVDLAKTIYSKAENSPFGFDLRPYGSSILKEASDATQQIIYLYENEEKKFDEMLKGTDSDYLVEIKEEIEKEKNEINSLIELAKDTQEKFSEISENYSSSILTLQRISLYKIPENEDFNYYVWKFADITTNRSEQESKETK
ncbi:MAG: hypothetical protein PWQ28_2 [Candidatus Woesearchaeota archaeon]|nr:hypothetical protein [Candidatus Woesearchaeota archaeon]